MIKRISTICALAIAALCFAGVAGAADSSAAGNGSQQELMSQFAKDAQQLRQIHDKTVKNDPELAKEQKQFQNKVRSAIKKQGYDVDAGQKRMQAMAKKLQSKDLSDKQRKATMKQFQQERAKMMKAQNAAFSQPDIKQAGKKLQNDTLEAMNKQDPKTKQLISDMKSKRQELQKSQGGDK